MKRTIKIKSGIKYLSEQLNELPKNCLFDKGKTGCGGTTLAIDNKHPYVIAVPFVSLIENKLSQNPNILGIYGGISVKEIKEYLSSTKNPIIMTTYDSLERVGKYINTSKFKLLVDEYHLLFTQYSFRDEAIDSLLKNYSQYKEYCFMTATPLDEEFILEELKELDVVKAEWEDVSEVKVNSIQCINGVTNSVIDLINAFLEDKEQGNLYLFVNSVSFIKLMINSIEPLNYSNCNAIYSKNNKTEIDIDRGILPIYKDGRISPKKINLLTSTVFEGSDIYDENGRIFIVSDSENANTLIDISTSFQQIAGRIRNSKYIREINHLYTHTRYSSLSYEEFLKMSENQIIESKEICNEYNNLSERARSHINVKLNETYINKADDGYYIFNPNKIKLDLYNFKVSKHLYKIRINNISNLETELNKVGYKSELFTHTTETRVSPLDLDGFEKTVKNIQEFYNEFKIFNDKQESYLQASFIKYPFLEEAINKLGFEILEKEGYVITNIKRRLTLLIDINIDTKIFKLLKTYSDVNVGEFIPSSVLKERFSKIYKSLELNNTAKGSDIEKYFNVKPSTKRIKNKIVQGYTLANPKLIIK